MALVMHDPFFNQIERAMDKAMEHAFIGFPRDVLSSSAPVRALAAGANPMDIIETDAAYELHADAPGMTADNISIEMHEGMLTVKGERTTSTQHRDAKVHRQERTSTKFTRSFRVPDNADADGVAASLENGVLVVTIPKKPEPKKEEPKRIAIKSASVCAAGGGAATAAVAAGPSTSS